MCVVRVCFWVHILCINSFCLLGDYGRILCLGSVCWTSHREWRFIRMIYYLKLLKTFKKSLCTHTHTQACRHMLIITNDCFHIAPYSTLEHSLQFIWFTLFSVQAGSFELSIIHWTLTETTGSLTCICDPSAPVYAQGTPVYSLIQKIFVESSQNATLQKSQGVHKA